MTEAPQQRVATEHLRDYSQLRRSLTDRKIAGVAGGLGRHLNIDPTVIRVILVVLCFFGGAGFLLYGAAWLLVPEEGKDEAVISTSPSTRNALLIAAAVVAAFLLIGDSWGGFGFPWPLVLVGLVVLLVLTFREKPMSDQTPAGPPAGSPPPSGGTGVIAPGAGGTTPTGPTGPTDDTTVYGAEPPAPPWLPPAGPTYPSPAPPAHRGPKLFWVTLALVAVALGTLGLVEVAGADVPDAAYPALALTVIGAMLVLGAWVGRAGGLILLGVVAALALAAASVAEPRFGGDRRTVEDPVTATRVEDRYFVPAGSILLDMSNIHDIARLDGRTIEVEARAGDLTVVLPEGVDAVVDADIAVAGEANIAGEVFDGTNVHVQREIDGGADAPEIELKMDLVVGSIEVRQP